MRPPRVPLTALLIALLSACASEETAAPEAISGHPAAVAPAAPPREVFRLESDGADGLTVSGVAPTPEARSLLLEEIRRRWPGRRVSNALVVEDGAPALWVPEAMALMPYVAGVEAGGLTVLAQEGAAGGGVLSITGRVADDAALARLAADAQASIAPPFVVETPLDVGLPADTLASEAGSPSTVAVISAGQRTEAAAGQLRAAVADGQISFRPGTADLEADAAPVLDRVASALAAHSGVAVEVSAAGEGSGSSILDRALSERRARAVADALRSRGIGESRVVIARAEGDPASVTLRLLDAASE